MGSFQFLGPNGLFLGLRMDSKIVSGSTHVVEQLSFFMIPSIVIFEFDLILGSSLSFWGPNGLVWGSEQGSTTVSGSTHVVEQLSFSMFP